ncbi:MAG: hydroxymethylglutaryl-CoA reductase, degradative [Vicingaceae bacterium]
MKPIKGFSKLTKEAKIDWLINDCLDGDEKARALISDYWHPNADVQKIHDEFIENTLTNFYMPFGIAPNFLINDKMYCIPMAIEESSVVAAASKAASYWLHRGGFKAEVVSMLKNGQVHFAYYGNYDQFLKFFNRIKAKFFEDTNEITANMRKRGGGIKDIQIINKTYEEPNYYQLSATFETSDAMGANFINSCLEQFAQTMKREILSAPEIDDEHKDLVVIMCILSNYTPECLVHAEVSCSIEDLTGFEGITPKEFAKKFEQAIHVARIEPYRATTHNKGIFNGIDAVVLATGNDFRAIEAGGHTYASRTGQYRSLSDVSIDNGIFRFWIDIPISLGTVGGITNLHPLVKLAHQILGFPNAEELMKIVAVAGLAQNFGAVSSLVTTGIQRGHMKMHLLNILNQLGANEQEKEQIVEYFRTRVVTFPAVTEIFSKLRASGLDPNTKG